MTNLWFRCILIILTAITLGLVWHVYQADQTEIVCIAFQQLVEGVLTVGDVECLKVTP